MKILHFADMHLDSKLQSIYSDSRAKERRNELLVTFTRIIEYAQREGITIILISGDLFDSRNISTVTANVVLDAINGHPGIDFFYLRGNHDCDAFLSSIDVFPDNLHTFSRNWTTYSILNKVFIHGIEFIDEEDSRASETFIADPANLNIVMLHGQEIVSSGRDRTTVIDIRQFRNKGIDYMALGHVHTYKREQLDGRGIYCYSGCPEVRGFDEPGTHGFVVLDIDEDNRIIKDTFVPFDTRRLYEVSVDITGLTNSYEMCQRIRENINTTGVTEDDLLKIILTGEICIEDEKDTDYISKVFSDDYYAFRLEDNSSYKVDYGKYAMEASLKGEFVRLCMQDDTLEEEIREQIIKTGLDAISGGSNLC